MEGHISDDGEEGEDPDCSNSSNWDDQEEFDDMLKQELDHLFDEEEMKQGIQPSEIVLTTPPAQHQAIDATTTPARPEQISSLLAVLPFETLTRVLACVSANDLGVLQQTCVFMRQLSGQEILWRRLCLDRDASNLNPNAQDVTHVMPHRWGARLAQPPSFLNDWKARYHELDSSECSETLHHLSGPMLEVFTAMQQAKRKRCAAPLTHEEWVAGHECQTTTQIAAWRRSKGFQSSPQTGMTAGPSSALSSPRPAASRTAKSTFTHVVGDMFGCNATGWMHLCDDSCSEMVTELDNELLVCPLSGRTAHRMLSVCEQRQARAERKRRGCGDLAAEPDFDGRLARAYTAGYYANSEKELKRLCGSSLYD